MPDSKPTMDEVYEAINDLDMAGGELSWRASDLEHRLEGRNLKFTERIRLIAAAHAAVKLVQRVGAIRKQLGLKERPEGG
jgi:hypothetical protein